MYRSYIYSAYTHSHSNRLPLSYRFAAVTALVWCVAWFVWVRDNPQDDRWITRHELELLERSLGSVRNEKVGRPFLLSSSPPRRCASFTLAVLPVATTAAPSATRRDATQRWLALVDDSVPTSTCAATRRNLRTYTFFVSRARADSAPVGRILQVDARVGHRLRALLPELGILYDADAFAELRHR